MGALHPEAMPCTGTEVPGQAERALLGMAGIPGGICIARKSPPSTVMGGGGIIPTGAIMPGGNCERPICAEHKIVSAAAVSESALPIQTMLCMSYRHGTMNIRSQQDSHMYYSLLFIRIFSMLCRDPSTCTDEAGASQEAVPAPVTHPLHMHLLH